MTAAHLAIPYSQWAMILCHTLSQIRCLSTRPRRLITFSRTSTSSPNAPGHSRACGNATAERHATLSIHHTNTAAASQSALAGTSSYRRRGGAASSWGCPTTCTASSTHGPPVAAHRASVHRQAHRMRGRQVPLDCPPASGGLLHSLDYPPTTCSLVRSLYT